MTCSTAVLLIPLALFGLGEPACATEPVPSGDLKGRVQLLGNIVDSACSIRVGNTNKEQVVKALTWWNEGAYLDLSSVPGMQARGDLSTSGLYLSVPQDQLEYTATNWDPPSRSDEGISGVLFDYNFNAQTTDRKRGKGRSDSLSGNGSAGVNLGSWRLRDYWQSQMQHSARQPSQQQFAWSRFYALRAVPSLRSSLILGEDYLDSDLFGSFRYTVDDLSSDLNYNHQTYWNSQANDRYSLSLSRYLDVGGLKNLSRSLTAYRNKSNGILDDGAYLSISIPWDSTGSFSYGSSANRGESAHSLSYCDSLDARSRFMLSAGETSSGASASGYLSDEVDQAQVVASASYQAGEYTSAGLSQQGGATLTGQGAALHRSGVMGGTRLLVDTQGVAGAPVRGNGRVSRTNRFGKAVITDVGNYYRNQANIALDELADDVEATQSITQATLTEGAIGYRRFNVIAGHKAMVLIRLSNSTAPPFDAITQNSLGQETGIVGEEGSTYLSGRKPGETMSVHWDGAARCHFTLPDQVQSTRQLELLCQPISDGGQRRRLTI